MWVETRTRSKCGHRDFGEGGAAWSADGITELWDHLLRPFRCGRSLLLKFLRSLSSYCLVAATRAWGRFEVMGNAGARDPSAQGKGVSAGLTSPLLSGDFSPTKRSHGARQSLHGIGRPV